jgi:mRNA-degrading endonuclease RelE of RelBE toxin-antitoxin system
MYDLFITPTADRTLRKLSKKNRKQLLMIHKKITEIREKPYHNYNHLRKPFEDLFRIHIDSSFVLIFAIDHTDQKITIYFYGHHDTVYKWKPKTKF